MEPVDRGRGGLLSVIDTSEEKRIGHWRDLGEKTIRREVLEIVGWLGREPGQTVPTATDRGIQWVDEAEAANVVFLRPKSVQEQRELDEVLLEAEYRIGQRRRVEALYKSAVAEKSAAEKEIEAIQAGIDARKAEVEGARNALASSVASIRQLVEEVRAKGTGVAPSDCARCATARVELAGLRTRVSSAEARLSDRVRSTQSALRVASQRLAKATASATLHEQELRRDSVAFKSVARWVLDRLALYTASTANEELRRNPRPNLRSARELEEELDSQ